VIAPSNFHPGMSHAEAVEGYIADGESREDAEAFATVLLKPAPDQLPVI